MDNISNIEMYSAMQEDKPIRTWIKTILGKVYIVAWDDMTEQPTGMLLEGDPKKFEESTIIKIWSTKGDVFFKNMNRILISRGIIKEYVPETVVKKSIEEATDEELLEILNARFLSTQAKVNKIDNIPVLFRLEELAKTNEKSDSVIALITARISELQGN